MDSTLLKEPSFSLIYTYAEYGQSWVVLKNTDASGGELLNMLK